ncbi:MAG TPA: DUF4287 domain-containing protein [Thermoanaerobaculia bacterium]|nr:DUF4287 domain-containing protein [Thermoanaerobaculia bacterium]
MTQLKKLKKSIRSRSEKTGESYTAARRQVLLAQSKKAETAEPAAAVEVIAAVPAPPVPPSPRAAAASRGSVSDESARKKTGHGLDHWFAVLDEFGAAAKGHTAAATHLYEQHGIPGWHAQGITVAYERARGLREMNQSCTGTFQVNVSKTVPAGVAVVIEALESAGQRAEWLEGADPGLIQALDAAFLGDKPREVKTKGSDYAWLRFPWDGGKVEIRITAKPKGASVVADNSNLASPEQVEQRRAQWRLALEGLQRYLGGE